MGEKRKRVVCKEYTYVGKKRRKKCKVYASIDKKGRPQIISSSQSGNISFHASHSGGEKIPDKPPHKPPHKPPPNKPPPEKPPEKPPPNKPPPDNPPPDNPPPDNPPPDNPPPDNPPPDNPPPDNPPPDNPPPDNPPSDGGGGDVNLDDPPIADQARDRATKTALSVVAGFVFLSAALLITAITRTALKIRQANPRLTSIQVLQRVINYYAFQYDGLEAFMQSQNKVFYDFVRNGQTVATATAYDEILTASMADITSVAKENISVAEFLDTTTDIVENGLLNTYNYAESVKGFDAELSVLQTTNFQETILQKAAKQVIIQKIRNPVQFRIFNERCSEILREYQQKVLKEVFLLEKEIKMFKEGSSLIESASSFNVGIDMPSNIDPQSFLTKADLQGNSFNAGIDMPSNIQEKSFLTKADLNASSFKNELGESDIIANEYDKLLPEDLKIPDVDEIEGIEAIEKIGPPIVQDVQKGVEGIKYALGAKFEEGGSELISKLTNIKKMLAGDYGPHGMSGMPKDWHVWGNHDYQAIEEDYLNESSMHIQKLKEDSMIGDELFQALDMKNPYVTEAEIASFKNVSEQYAALYDNMKTADGVYQGILGENVSYSQRALYYQKLQKLKQLRIKALRNLRYHSVKYYKFLKQHEIDEDLAAGLYEEASKGAFNGTGLYQYHPKETLYNNPYDNAVLDVKKPVQNHIENGGKKPEVESGKGKEPVSEVDKKPGDDLLEDVQDEIEYPDYKPRPLTMDGAGLHHRPKPGGALDPYKTKPPGSSGSSWKPLQSRPPESSSSSWNPFKSRPLGTEPTVANNPELIDIIANEKDFKIPRPRPPGPLANAKDWAEYNTKLKKWEQDFSNWQTDRVVDYSEKPNNMTLEEWLTEESWKTKGSAGSSVSGPSGWGGPKEKQCRQQGRCTPGEVASGEAPPDGPKEIINPTDEVVSELHGTNVDPVEAMRLQYYEFTASGPADLTAEAFAAYLAERGAGWVVFDAFAFVIGDIFFPFLDLLFLIDVIQSIPEWINDVKDVFKEVTSNRVILKTHWDEYEQVYKPSLAANPTYWDIQENIFMQNQLHNDSGDHSYDVGHQHIPFRSYEIGQLPNDEGTYNPYEHHDMTWTNNQNGMTDDQWTLMKDSKMDPGYDYSDITYYVFEDPGAPNEHEIGGLNPHMVNTQDLNYHNTAEYLNDPEYEGQLVFPGDPGPHRPNSWGRPVGAAHFHTHGKIWSYKNPTGDPLKMHPGSILPGQHINKEGWHELTEEEKYAIMVPKSKNYHDREQSGVIYTRPDGDQRYTDFLINYFNTGDKPVDNKKLMENILAGNLPMQQLGKSRYLAHGIPGGKEDKNSPNYGGKKPGEKGVNKPKPVKQRKKVKKKKK